LRHYKTASRSVRAVRVAGLALFPSSAFCPFDLMR
jgi:hypothetical protein